MALFSDKDNIRSEKEKLFKDRVRGLGGPAGPDKPMPRLPWTTHPDVGPWRPAPGPRPEGKTVTYETADLNDRKTSRLEKRVKKLTGRADKQRAKSSKGKYEHKYQRISDRIKKLKSKQKTKTVTTTVYPRPSYSSLYLRGGIIPASAKKEPK